MTYTVSRRAFLRNMGVAAAGTAVGASALGLAGCSSSGGSDGQAWDKEAEVVIVGFGGAGACAAISAADAGASVLVLEKNAEAEHLCNTVMSGGIFHSPDQDGDKEALKESPYQDGRGIVSSIYRRHRGQVRRIRA